MLEHRELGPITDLRSGTTWSPAEFQAQIARRRCRLAALGVSRRDKVVIAHGGSPSFFADLLAAWSLGACGVCLNPCLTKAELTTVVDFVGPRLVLVSRAAPAAVEDLRVPVVDTSENGATAEPLGTAAALTKRDPALILFTSGTSGNPKGVVHSAGTLAARLGLNRRYIGDAVFERTLCVLPTHFGHGLIGNCLTPLSAAAHLFLFPTPGIEGASRVSNLLCDHDITFLSSVPAFWKIVMKTARPPATRTLRQVNIGSAPLSAELWKAVMSWVGIDNVCNVYGMTETANWTAGASAQYHRPEDGLVGEMWGGEAAVLREDARLESEGQGEILLRAPSLMSGYLRRDDLTAAVFRNGWYWTGDLGTIDANGQIRLRGRRKSEINRAGTKVLPEEVDLLLERHPAVAEACTFGIPDSIYGEMVAAAVRLLDDNVTATSLKQWCGERIHLECVPEKWFFLPEIPKTDRGKVNRAAVRDECLMTKT